MTQSKTTMRLSSLHILVLFVALAQSSFAQHGHEHVGGRAIEFPDTAEYLSLTCDLHMHSVFSDGEVWPSIRVQEAQRDHLDCIAITEHLEYQPHSDDIPHPDRNRAFELAVRSAGESGLIVIPGTEITRGQPYGHANAVFISDANPMLVDDAEDAYAEAARQGGFTFINHPNWTSQRRDGIARMQPEQADLIQKGFIHGIEVVNDLTYSDEALELALEYDLAIIGTSDIHGLVDWQFELESGGHRPVTIVLAKERSPEGIKEALFERRTVAYYHDSLIGRPEHVGPLLDASLGMKSLGYIGVTSILQVSISNDSDAAFTLQNTSAYRFHNMADVVVIPPHASVRVQIKTETRLTDITLPFEALNVITRPGEHPTIELTASISPE